MMPGISRNWRRTSLTTEPAARPTASIASAPNRNGTSPPMNRPMMMLGSLRSKALTAIPSSVRLFL